MSDESLCFIKSSQFLTFTWRNDHANCCWPASWNSEPTSFRVHRSTSRSRLEPVLRIGNIPSDRCDPFRGDQKETSRVQGIGARPKREPHFRLVSEKGKVSSISSFFVNIREPTSELPPAINVCVLPKHTTMQKIHAQIRKWQCDI